MRSGLNLTFWGQLLLIVDFYVNGFDIAPDVVGLVLNAWGCSAVAQRSHQFQIAFYLTIAMGVFWLMSFFGSGSDLRMLAYISSACNCWLIWTLLGGIREVALQQERYDIAESAHVRRIVFVVLTVCFMLGPRLFFNPFTGLVGVVISWVLMLAILFMVLSVIHRARGQLS